AQAIEQTHAHAGTVVVQDPNSGELLAVANWPTFDPNDPGKYPDQDRIDRAVASAYEPGSTFKVLTLTGAIESGVAGPDEMIDCQMGKILVAGRTIHDWKKFGVLSVKEILEHSSDVGAIKVALRLGAPRFYDTARAFGIGQPTGIELPGENRGLLRPIENWSASSIGSLAMGQEVSVTPIQIISAISAVANGGTLYAPHIVREMDGGKPGSLRPLPEPHQATDGRTAATMRDLMEGVVLEGTGKPARLAGYTAGGKSGTAQQIDPKTGRYSLTQYNSSFVGFAPVNNPAITILVVLDSPVGPHHGGEVGGPVFKRVAEQTLAYLGVPHDIPSPDDVETAQNSRSAAHPSLPPKDDGDSGRQAFADVVARASQSSGPTQTVAFGDQDVTVPTLVLESVRDVTEQCSKLGLEPMLIGTGVAVEQYPEAGAQVLRGSQITVRFGRPGELKNVSARRGGN
ncbi:MAG TPA: penicillin-binding transpeptidase domain-containing protein, partial [Candidatus Aquilonibacter sp.]|nr:penicillin-binding transpeptidase domain-containing protein [Candidatus Aquilonibacter sp.]